MAVLCSGGIDSIVLVADLASTGPVQPLYVASGFTWESSELAGLQRVLTVLPQARSIHPLAVLTMPVDDLYPPDHWAFAGTPPAYDTPDGDVYLPGRNVALIGKAGTYCALHAISRVCLAPLAGNPFPDATPDFFAAMSRALSMGLDAPLTVDAPYRELFKADVIRRGHALGVPLELTVSCMKPHEFTHCGACSKCRERREAFADAGVPDPTSYAHG